MTEIICTDIDMNNPLILARLEMIKIDENGCHIYQSNLVRGYAAYTVRYKSATRLCYLHRFVLAKNLNLPYEELDQACHRCNVKSCINIDHLYHGNKFTNAQDAIKVNTHPWFYKTQLTHCPKGHEYNEENTRLVGTGRSCWTCIRDGARESWRKTHGYYDRHPR